MILKKHISIGNIKYKNDSVLQIEFNNNFQPYLIFQLREENTYSYANSIKLPVFLPFERTIEIIKENSFNNNVSLGTFSLVHGTGGEIMDIVKYNSQEYKNLIKSNKIKPSTIEQGSFVKLQDGREAIFIGQYKSLDRSNFLNILRFIVDPDHQIYGFKYYREQRIELFEDIHKKNILLNIFVSPEDGNIFIEKSAELKSSIIEVYSVVEQYNKNNFSLTLKFKELNINTLSDFCFDLNNIDRYGRHNSFPENVSDRFFPYFIETEPGYLIRISGLLNRIREDAIAIENQEG